MTQSNGHLPRGWILETIGTLCQINPRHAHGIPSDLPVSFVPMAAVCDQKGQIESSEVRPYGEVCKGYTHFENGDVIFAKITPCMENGKAASVRGLENGIGCGTTEFFVFRPSEAMNQDYLFHFIRQSSFRRAARETMQSGVGQARVPKDFVENTQIPVPPPEEQRRIVAKIEALQTRSRRVREALAEVGPLLEQFRRSLLAAAFRGDLTAKWREGHPEVETATNLLLRSAGQARERLTRRRIQKKGTVSLESALFHDVPPSWCYATVQECLDAGLIRDFVDGNHGALYPRKAAFGEHGVPFITAKQIANGVVDFSTAPRLSEPVARRLQKGWAVGGDVLLTHNATVGRTARTPADIGDFLLGTSVTYYRTNPNYLNGDYLYHLLSAPQWQRQMTSIMEQTTRDQVSIQKQAFFRIPIAPVEEQIEIARILDAICVWIGSIEHVVVEGLDRLNDLDDSILAKAFRGELVPQDPNDEPAESLLARARNVESDGNGRARSRSIHDDQKSQPKAHKHRGKQRVSK